MNRLKEREQRQPCLFRIGTAHYIKADNTAIQVSSAVCFTEAVECLLMTFFVFNVQYPDNLRVFYSFLDMLCGINSSALLPTVRTLLQELEVAEVEVAVV